MSWPRIPIDQLCETIVDCVNRTAPVVDNPTPFKMIRTTNVKSGWVNLAEVRHVDEATYRIWTRRQVPRRGDVILTREAPLGEVGIIRTDDNVFLGQRLVAYRSNCRKLDSRFLLYSLQGADLQGQIRALGSGSTVEHMRVPDAKALLVPTPPLATQNRIADILSAYDDLIENNTRRIAILEDMARRLFEEWFVSGRVPNGQPALTKKVMPISDAFDIVGGGTPSKAEPRYWDQGTIEWYTPTDLTRARAAFLDQSKDRITEVGLAKSGAQRFPANSVMMTSRATLGVFAINTVPATTNQGFITSIPNENAPLFWLFHWLKANADRFEGIASGATFKEITKGNFKNLEIELPDRASVQAYEGLVIPMMETVLSLLRTNTKLRTTRDLLLPKLISGEIEVRAAEVELEAAAA